MKIEKGKKYEIAEYWMTTPHEVIAISPTWDVVCKNSEGNTVFISRYCSFKELKE